MWSDGRAAGPVPGEHRPYHRSHRQSRLQENHLRNRSDWLRDFALFVLGGGRERKHGLLYRTSAVRIGCGRSRQRNRAAQGGLASQNRQRGPTRSLPQTSLAPIKP